MSDAYIKIASFVIFCIAVCMWVIPTEKMSFNVFRRGKKRSNTVHNYQARYCVASKKYYIVNVYEDAEVPLTTWYGKKYKFSSHIQANTEIEHLNSV